MLGLNRKLIPKAIESINVGETIDLLMTYEAGPANFRGQSMGSHDEFEAMVQSMQTHYNNAEPVNLTENSLAMHEYYACKRFEDDLWERVQLVNVFKISAMVYCIDSGETVLKFLNDLQPLSDDYRNLPEQIIFCKLAGVKPKRFKWSFRDCVRFRSLVAAKQIKARVDFKDVLGNSGIVGLGVNLKYEEGNTTIDIGQQLNNERRAVVGDSYYPY